MRQRILFGEYLPDLAPHLNPGLTVANGVYAAANGYRPVGGHSLALNGTLPAACLGAVGAKATDGTAYVFAGTTTNLYRYTSAGWSSVAAGLSASASIGWRFCQFKNNLLATDGVDPIKVFDLASPVAFSNLGGSPPTARFLAVVREFVVAGFAAGTNIRVQWSDRDAPTSWTAGGASLAGSADMAAGGEITGLVGGEYGIILQEGRVVRMSYTADPDSPFQFDEISGNVGCIAPWSVASYGRLVFFLSERGWMVCDGQSVTPIGAEKIDRTFLSRIDRTQLTAMSAVVDPKNTLLIVTEPSANPATRLWFYNWTLQRWSTATVTAEKLLVGLSQSVTLEDLNTLFASLEVVTASLDDQQWRGGYPAVYLFDGSHRFGSLTGTPVEATITTGDLEMVQGQRTRLQLVRPLDDAGAGTLTVSGRNVLSDDPTSTTYSTLNRGGAFKVRQNHAFLRLSRVIPAGTDWTFAQGADAEFEAGGRA